MDSGSIFKVVSEKRHVIYPVLSHDVSATAHCIIPHTYIVGSATAILSFKLAYLVKVMVCLTTHSPSKRYRYSPSARSTKLDSVTKTNLNDGNPLLPRDQCRLRASHPTCRCRLQGPAHDKEHLHYSRHHPSPNRYLPGFDTPRTGRVAVYRKP